MDFLKKSALNRGGHWLSSVLKSHYRKGKGEPIRGGAYLIFWPGGERLFRGGRLFEEKPCPLWLKLSATFNYHQTRKFQKLPRYGDD